VLYGVRRELTDDEGDRAGHVRRRRVAPFLQPPDGVTPGELCSSWRGGELLCEHVRFELAAVEPHGFRRWCCAALRLVSRGGGFCQHGLVVPFRRVEVLRGAHESSRSVLKGRPIVLRSTGAAALLFRP
jgi:hypothetical protein